ncbi:MAG: hypothetical protein APR54_12440 [Candidatus Cloacimonas sp. SDB]|nr:MAG: hypothetical protein APR54_12440 [Candidatus Cloacimonas sp. SDB]
MKFKQGLITFFTLFIISFVVSIAVTFLWSLVFHETTQIDWENSFRLALILGIIISIIDVRKEKG